MAIDTAVHAPRPSRRARRNTAGQPEEAKDRLLSDFRVVVEDVEALLKATAEQGGEEFAELRTRARQSLRVAKGRMNEAQEELLDRANDAVQNADDYVHDNPWNAIGIAAGIGLVIGLLSSRH